MKLCTCFSALVNSSFLAITATTIEEAHVPRIPVITAMLLPQYVFGTMSPYPTERNVMATSQIELMYSISLCGLSTMYSRSQRRRIHPAMIQSEAVKIMSIVPGHIVIRVFSMNRALKLTRLRPAILRLLASVKTLKRTWLWFDQHPERYLEWRSITRQSQ